MPAFVYIDYTHFSWWYLMKIPASKLVNILGTEDGSYR